MFRTLTCWEPEAYSKLSQTSTTKHFAKIVNSYKYFHNIGFTPSLLYEKDMTFFNAGLIFTPEVYILCKKGMTVEGAGAMNVYRYTVFSKFVYCQVWRTTRSLLFHQWSNQVVNT